MLVLLHYSLLLLIRFIALLPEMLPCLRRVLRPALSLRAGTGLATAGFLNHQTPAVASTARFASDPMLIQRCHLGTHPLKEPVEPLTSPRGAKEFIYSLHPSERSCLLRELHRFESMAIAQGRSYSTVTYTMKLEGLFQFVRHRRQYENQWICSHYSF